MKNGKFLGGMVSCAVGTLLASGLNAGAATVIMNVDNYTSYTTATSDYVGVYQFNVTAADPGTTSLGNFWSVCLSPNGTLSGGTDPIANAYTYNYQDFNAAATGLNGPAPWAGSSVGNGGYGIQNAQYLWSVFGSASAALSATKAAGTVGSVQEQGAGLAAAMYVALYDSTAIGTYDINAGGKYNPITALNLDANVETDMNADLSLLNQPGSATTVSDNMAVGYVLDPVSPAPGGPSGQEFIILASNSGNVAVPEPASSGVIAGAFMLLAVIGNAFLKKKGLTLCAVALLSDYRADLEIVSLFCSRGCAMTQNLPSTRMVPCPGKRTWFGGDGSIHPPLCNPCRFWLYCASGGCDHSPIPGSPPCPHERKPAQA